MAGIHNLSCPNQLTDGIINEYEPSLAASLWRFKWLILAVGVLAAAVGYGASMLQPESYEVEGQLILSDPRTAGGVAAEIGLVLDPSRYVRNQAEIVATPQVAAEASRRLGGDPSPSEVQRSTSASASNSLDVLTIAAVQPTGAEAVDMVNAVALAYETVVQAGIATKVQSSIETLEQSKSDLLKRITEIDAGIASDSANATLEAQRIAAVSQLVALESRIEELSTNAALYGSGVQVYVSPELPSSPTTPRPLRNAFIALLVGMLAAGTWAWWRAQRDQRADNRSAPAEILGAPLLAVIPEYADTGPSSSSNAGLNPGAEAAEAYQFAVSSVHYALKGIEGTTVVVTSAAPGEGKTVTALNIALAAANDGRRTLLVDADVRARGLTRLSGLGIGFGLTDLANGQAVSEIVGKWEISKDTPLAFVPAGRPLNANAAPYFRSATFRTALRDLSSRHDIVIIDTPPAMAAAETTDIAAQADGVVLVVRQGTPLSDIHDARQRLSIADSPILGYVFNRGKGTTGSYGYGYVSDAGD